MSRRETVQMPRFGRTITSDAFPRIRIAIGPNRTIELPGAIINRQAIKLGDSIDILVDGERVSGRVVSQ